MYSIRTHGNLLLKRRRVGNTANICSLIWLECFEEPADCQLRHDISVQTPIAGVDSVRFLSARSVPPVVVDPIAASEEIFASEANDATVHLDLTTADRDIERI